MNSSSSYIISFSFIKILIFLFFIRRALIDFFKNFNINYLFKYLDFLFFIFFFFAFKILSF